jgi:hypothetical protein
VNTITHLRAEIRRYSDKDIMAIKELVETEYNRRFDSEKASAQSVGVSGK